MIEMQSIYFIYVFKDVIERNYFSLVVFGVEPSPVRTECVSEVVERNIISASPAQPCLALVIPSKPGEQQDSTWISSAALRLCLLSSVSQLTYHI